MRALKDGSRPAFRVVHIDNLALYLEREALHSAHHAPGDGRIWRDTHLAEAQERRGRVEVPAGPRGVLLDYVPFHLGARNLFLFNLVTGRVPGVGAPQADYLTLVVSVEEVFAHHVTVFTDGHALHGLTRFYDDLGELASLDWDAIHGRRFGNDDPDRKRKKQAEFLVHRELPWSRVRGIGVMSDSARERVDAIQSRYGPARQRPLHVAKDWYFEGR